MINKEYVKSLKPWKIIYMLQDIETIKYYESFRVKMEKNMFEKELNDLENTYKAVLKELDKQVEDCLPSLLHYMKEFVELHGQTDEVRHKLNALLAKTGRENEEEYEDEDE
jgi:hypothetical protein